MLAARHCWISSRGERCSDRIAGATSRSRSPNAFAGWRRPFNVCGLEATSVKIRWGSADPGCSDHRVERSYRAVSFDGADHYLILFQVVGQTAMTQMDQAAQLAVGDVALIDGAVNGVGKVASGVGSFLRLAQSGYIRNYAAWVVVGAILAIGWIGLRVVAK